MENTGGIRAHAQQIELIRVCRRLETSRPRTAQKHGYPASTLTDNGMVYTVRLAVSKNSGGRTGLENELFHRGIIQKNGSPHHPQTQGKVERFQQTFKKSLRAQPQ